MKLLEKVTISSLFLLAITFMVWQNKEADAASGRFSLLAATSTSSGAGTSTVKYLDTSTTKASSTLQFATGNTDHIDLDIQYNASSSNSTLQYTIEHADNDPTTGHIGDWFCQASAAVTSAGTSTVSTFGPKCPVYQWTPGKSGISRISIPITDLGAKFLRIRFSSKDGNGSIWAQPIQRYPN